MKKIIKNTMKTKPYT